MPKIDEKKAGQTFPPLTGPCISDTILTNPYVSDFIQTSSESQGKTAGNSSDTQELRPPAVTLSNPVVTYSDPFEIPLETPSFEGVSGGGSGGSASPIILIKEGYEVSSLTTDVYIKDFEGDPIKLLPEELQNSGRELQIKLLTSLVKLNPSKYRDVEFLEWLRLQPDNLENQLFDLPGRIEKMSYCADILYFKHYYTVGKIRMSGHFCQEHLACRICAIRRSARLLRSYAPKMVEYMKTNQHLKPVLITFTVPNGENLKKTFNLLQGSFRKLMRKAYEHQRGQKKTFVEMSRVKGAIASYEIKRGSGSNLWHPHIHVLAFIDSDFSCVSLIREWSAAVGIEKANVNVKRIKYDPEIFSSDIDQLTDIDLLSEKSSLGGSLVEVLKYPMKFQDLPNEDIFEVWKKFKGARLLQTYGSEFKSVKVPDVDSEDENLKDLPYIQILVDYDHSRKGYSLNSISRAVVL